jgi:hypothetical protein
MILTLGRRNRQAYTINLSDTEDENANEKSRWPRRSCRLQKKRRTPIDVARECEPRRRLQARYGRKTGTVP